nr:MAG TPA: hypothetical protein [Bacteriophage sp.]
MKDYVLLLGGRASIAQLLLLPPPRVPLNRPDSST